MLACVEQEEEDGGEAMLVVHDDDEGGAPPLSPSQALPDDDVSNMFSPDSPMARVSLGLNLPRTPGSEQAAEAPPSTSKKSRKVGRAEQPDMRGLEHSESTRSTRGKHSSRISVLGLRPR